MGKLYCDIEPHKGEVKVVPPDCLDKVQDAVTNHMAAAVRKAIGAMGMAGPGWHIIPDGGDWHITRYP